MKDNESKCVPSKDNGDIKHTGPAPVLIEGKAGPELAAGLKSIREIMKEAVAQKLMPGGCLLMAQHGQIIFEEYIGFADLEQRLPYGPEIIKFYGSNSKPLSATAILTLVDDGEIALDDPISKYLPEFGDLKLKKTGERVAAPTIRQCLSMTSGIFGNAEATASQFGILRQINLTLKDTVDEIAREPLNAHPGTYYSYSGASFQAVGRVVEVVTGKPFEFFFRERLSHPLGFDEMMFMNEPISDEKWRRLETVYAPNGKGEFDLAVKIPYGVKGNLTLVPGAVIGTCREYLAFLQMHLNGGSYGPTRILSGKLVSEMRRLHSENLDRSGLGTIADDYGIGWFISRADEHGMGRVYQHAGHWGTYGWVDLDRDMVGFWATNLPLAATVPILEKVYNRMLEVFPGEPAPFMRLKASPTGATEPPVIDEFTVAPDKIRAGDSATMSFYVTGLDMTAAIEPEIGNLGLYHIGFTEIKGRLDISPKATTTYKMTAVNPVGQVSRSITITVE